VPSSRPEHRFLDILDNIRLIQSYLHGMDCAASMSTAVRGTRLNAAWNGSARRRQNWDHRLRTSLQDLLGMRSELWGTYCAKPMIRSIRVGSGR
jgi:hypothetical protein